MLPRPTFSSFTFKICVLFWNNMSVHWSEILHKTLNNPLQDPVQSTKAITLYLIHWISKPHLHRLFIFSHKQVTQFFPSEIISSNSRICGSALNPSLNLGHKNDCLKCLYPFQAPLGCYLIQWLISGPLYLLAPLQVTLATDKVDR